MINIDLLFISNSILLGVGLAMDAFSVSVANGLNEPGMRKRKVCLIAGTFAVFQALMPMLGWICVHTIVELFSAFDAFVPWIALILLAFIGGKMIWDGIRKRSDDAEVLGVGFGALMIQGVATSIDALSVGFTIADYDLLHAVSASLIIAAVTFIICVGGLIAGRKIGTKLSDKAQIFGGVILIGIGLEIFISSFF